MLDLQCEVIQIMEAITSSLDHLDLVIQSLQSGVVDRRIAMIKQAIGVMIKRLCKVHQRFDDALFHGLHPL